MFLTVREAATLLRSTERQIYRWVDADEIPFRRVRDQVRFNQTDLLEWAASRQLTVSLEAFSAGLAPEDRAPSLGEALRNGGAYFDVRASDWETALRAAVGHTPMPPNADRELVFEVLLARAGQSTVIRDGLAIPHVRQPIVVPGAAAAASVTYLERAIFFGDREQRPVVTILLLVSPTIRTHLQLCARLARALHDADFQAALARHSGALELASEALRIEVSSSVPPPALRSDRGRT